MKWRDLGGNGDEAADADRQRLNLRENYRKQMLDSIGGWTGTLITALPTVVFVIVNATTSLRPAIVAAVGSAVVLAGYRLARKQSTQQAISGLFGVLIAALIAARTGQARGFFLLGIWTSFIYAVPFAVSMLVRRPLVGVIWEFLDPSPPDPAGRPWYRRSALLRAYLLATLFATLLFLSRGIVQATLYGGNQTGWLAFARVAMGYPLYVLVLAAAFWVVRRVRRSEPPEPAADGTLTAPPEPGTVPSPESADDGGADRRFGLG